MTLPAPAGPTRPGPFAAGAFRFRESRAEPEGQ